MKIIGNVSAVDHYCQHREDLYNELIKNLLDTPEHVVTLVGPKGVGKSAQALAFVYNQIPETAANKKAIPNYDFAIWINCDDFTNECIEIEKELGKQAYGLYHFLNNYDGQGKWLLILDQATEKNLSALPNTTKGHIIITSRDSLWPNQINVPHFTPLESQQLIGSILNFDLTKPEQAQLSIEMGDLLDHHPQAITDHMKYLIQNNYSSKDYYEKLAKEASLFFSNDLAKKIPIHNDILKIIEVLANDADHTCYRLLNFFSYMDSVFIPRLFLQNLIKSIDPTIADDKKKIQDKLNNSLLKLRQLGLIKTMEHSDDLYILAAPTLSVLRYHFTAALQNHPIFIGIIDLLKNKLEESSGGRSLDIQYYFMHSKKIIERLIGLKEIDQDLEDDSKNNNNANNNIINFEKRSTEKFLQVARKNLQNNLNKISAGLTPSVQANYLLSVLDFIISFVRDLRMHDELDEAYFYLCLINNFFENENYALNSLTIYRKVLFSRGATLLRRTLDYNVDEIEKGFELINKSCLMLKKEIRKIRNEIKNDKKEIVNARNSNDKAKEDNYKARMENATTKLAKLQKSFSSAWYYWFYAKYKSELRTLKPLDDSDVLIQQPDQLTLDEFKQLLTIDKVNNIVKINGLLGSNFKRSLDIPLTDSFFLMYTELFASILIHREKQNYYPNHRIVRLRELKNINVIRELLINDIFDQHDKNDMGYELNKALTLLLGWQGDYQKDNKAEAEKKVEQELKKECQKIQDGFTKFKKELKLKGSKLSREMILKHPTLKVITQRLYDVIPQYKNFSYPIVDNILKPLYDNPINVSYVTFNNYIKPFTDAIDALEEGLIYYKQNMTKTNDYNLISTCRKLGKLYLLRYRVYKENKHKDKIDLEKALRTSWQYYNDAMDAYQAFYQRDEPLLETVTIFLGLLELDLHFHAEKIPLEHWSKDVRYDYFLRCRFVLSHLFNNSYYFARKLFTLWQKLEPRYKEISSTNKDIFDIQVSPSQPYYQNELRVVEQRLLADTENIWLRYTRAVALLNLGRAEEAIKEFNKFAEIYPYSATAAAQIGLTQFKLQKYITALISFKKAQTYHGNNDSLVQIYSHDCRQALNIKLMELKVTIDEKSKEGMFIARLKEEFAVSLQQILDKASGVDNRLSGNEISVRVFKSVSKLIPKSAAFMGAAADIPIAESLNEIADLTNDVMKAKKNFEANKLKEAAKQLLPSEINSSPIFNSVAVQLVAIFQKYITYFTYEASGIFAEYLSHSMIDYLKSDRIIPYLPINILLLMGALEGKRKNNLFKHRGLAVELNEINKEAYKKDKIDTQGTLTSSGATFFNSKTPWTPHGIMKYSNILTPGNVLFKNKKHRGDYLAIISTEEEARRRGFHN